MNRHISSEMLSAYLDYEVDLPVRHELDRHFAVCEQCRAHLVSMQRVVSGLGQLERVAPPPALAFRIRREAEAQAAVASPWARLVALVRALPMRADLRTHCAMAMALVVSVFLVGRGVDREVAATSQESLPEEKVTVILGAPPEAYKEATSEVAGRTFRFTDRSGTRGVWVEQGLDTSRASLRIDAGSPVGQALLERYVERYEDLDILLEDGYQVVLQDDAWTFEISGTSRS